MLFCVCELFVSSELSFNIPKVRYTLGSLGFVEVGCSVQVLLLLVVYADPWLPGTNRLYAWTNHLPHLPYSLPPYTTVSQMMLLGDYTVDYRISYSHVILLLPFWPR